MTADGDDLVVMATVNGRPQSVSFTNGSIIVATACNSGGGEVVGITEGRLDILELTGETAGCDDPRRQAQETLVFELLNSDPHVSLEGDVLKLSSARFALTASAT